MHRTAQLGIALLVALSSLLGALANTEIRNFDAVREGIDELGWLSLKLKELDWTGLDANVSERNFQVEPAVLGTPLDRVCEQKPSDVNDSNSLSLCAHEVWVRLDLDDEGWSSFSKFTFRLSWPAFYPTDFDITIFSSSGVLRSVGSDTLITNPESWAATKPTRSTRKMYARIRLVDTGVRNPSHPSTLDTVSNRVPFTVKLEPLHFGVLPESVIPTILAILLVSGVSFFFVVPRVLGAFEVIGRKAAKELASSGSVKKNQ